MKLFTLFITACLIANILSAQPGTLDASFGKNGIAIYPGFGYVQAMALQADNKILIAGAGVTDSGYIFLTGRFMPDGSVDASFGDEGIVKTPFASVSQIYGLSVLKDGNILVSGYGYISKTSDYLSAILIQYLPDGTIDSSFGINGVASVDGNKISTNVYTTAMQVAADGSIVQAGYTVKYYYSSPKAIIIRYKTDGSLDNSFGTNGVDQISISGVDVINSVVVQPDGKIIIAGSYFVNSTDANFLIARLENNGALDASFGNGGRLNIDIYGNDEEIHAITLQPDGKILAAGRVDLNGFDDAAMALVRFNADGTFDNDFGKNGLAYCQFNDQPSRGNALVLQADGKINVGGYYFTAPDTGTVDFALAQFNTDGSLNTAFGESGKTITNFDTYASYINSLVLQKDGKIVAAGDANTNDPNKAYYNLAMTRYNNDVVLAEPLQHFAATAIPNGGVALSWQAANENGVSAYKAQRSANVQFNNVTQLAQVATGSSHYTYTDNAPLQGINYYRIQQVSNDGANSYSNIVSASVSGSVSISLFPNPVKDVVNIKGLDVIMNYKLLINNAKGDRVATTTISHISGYAWNVQPLASGVYYIRLTSNQNKTVTLRFVKE